MKKWIWLIVVLLIVIVIGVFVVETQKTDRGYGEEKNVDNSKESELPIITPEIQEDEPSQIQTETDSAQEEDVNRVDRDTKSDGNAKVEKHEDNSDKVESSESEDTSEIELPFISVP